MYQVIEGQNDTLAKLREMLHQSELGQLHVREGHRGEDAPFLATASTLLVIWACPVLAFLEVMGFTLFSRVQKVLPQLSSRRLCWTFRALYSAASWKSRSSRGGSDKRSASWPTPSDACSLQRPRPVSENSRERLLGSTAR